MANGWEVSPKQKAPDSKRKISAMAAAVMIITNRNLRSKFFKNYDIFGEPAWDMLLDLYLHESQNEQVSVKSASIGSGATPTTALRWLRTLESKGLILTQDDPEDHRRKLVHLTPEGRAKMTDFLSSVVR